MYLLAELPQWRAYRGRGGGYAIGFDFFHTIKLLDKPCTLRKVIYDRQQQSLLIETVVSDFLINVDDDDAFDKLDDKIFHYSLAFNNIMLEYLPSFKHPDFSEEREWRLLYKASDSPLRDRNSIPPRFRSFEGNVIPYHLVNFEKAVEASKDDSMGIPFPIVELNIGPTISGELNMNSTITLLQTINPDIDPDVTKSEIPLRWL